MQREPFTVRIPPDLASAVRERGGAHPRGTAGLVEAALRLYMSTMQADQERASLLSSVEDALLDRLDKRLGKAVEGLRDIAAKANFDQSLTLCLVTETLEALFANDRHALQKIFQGARQQAAKRLRRVSALSPEAESEAVAGLRREIEDLQQLVAHLREMEGAWRKQAHESGHDRDYWKEIAWWHERRYIWAREQEQAQATGTFGKRRPLVEFLEEYERRHPKPEKKVPKL